MGCAWRMDVYGCTCPSPFSTLCSKMETRTVGVLGGGQLGRMMAEAGHKMGIRLAILDPKGAQSPAGLISSTSIEGSFKDAEKVRELAKISDVITTEIEHVNVDVLEELEAAGHVVHPSAATIRTIQVCDGARPPRGWAPSALAPRRCHPYACTSFVAWSSSGSMDGEHRGTVCHDLGQRGAQKVILVDMHGAGQNS